MPVRVSAGALSEWFVDVQTGDLHLAYPVADVVDQGVPVDLLQDDIDRETQPQGTGIDIGTDEFTVCQADQDADSDADGMDLAEFSDKYADADPAADIDSSGHVDAADVARFAAAFGSRESFLYVYDVGPGWPYADPSDVLWESMAPGSLVRIHYREIPYANKWVLAVAGTADAPIVVRGIPQNGLLPIITGENATTRLSLDYWNEVRSVIKVGGSSRPSEFPTHVTIENLDVRSARPPYTFTDDRGNLQIYSTNAASIHVEMGTHVTIRNCILQNSGNGFFSGAQSANLLLEGNYIHDNGIDNSIYHHNNYTESLGITFQFNQFGPLRAGCKGNNLKDRSAGTVIRYNWIEAGNRTLDLVDSDHNELITDPSYRRTFVYGNILVKHDVVENGQVLHYGGDSGDEESYRKGILWFFNNTVVSYRSGNTTLMRLSSNDEHAQCFNNVVLPTDILPDHDLNLQYVRHQRFTDRFTDDHVDIGAFEEGE